MADTLVARLTGQEQADDTGFEVGLVMPLGALIDDEDPTPAEVPGMGLLPAGLARELIENAQARSCGVWSAPGRVPNSSRQHRRSTTR